MSGRSNSGTVYLINTVLVLAKISHRYMLKTKGLRAGLYRKLSRPLAQNPLCFEAVPHEPICEDFPINPYCGLACSFAFRSQGLGLSQGSGG